MSESDVPPFPRSLEIEFTLDLQRESGVSESESDVAPFPLSLEIEFIPDTHKERAHIESESEAPPFPLALEIDFIPDWQKNGIPPDSDVAPIPLSSEIGTIPVMQPGGYKPHHEAPFNPIPLEIEFTPDSHKNGLPSEPEVALIPFSTELDIQSEQESERLQKIVSWLSPLDFMATQSEIFQRREEGTGQWLLESTKFRYWRDGTSETLWCPGKLGSGKTVLSSIVVNHLKAAFPYHNIAIACIYFNYKEHASQTLPNLISSLLKQIVQSSHAISHDVDTLYKSHESQTACPTPEELITVLKSETEARSKVFIIVDALDECREDDGTQDSLLRELRSLPGIVNLMFTSRELASIAQEFQGTNHLEISAHDRDVQRYIEGRISRAGRRHLRKLQYTIINKVVANTRGMFLLARLHMDSLVVKHNAAAVHSALETLPREYYTMYDEAMERIGYQSKDDRELAKKVLMWISCAYRPLSVKELQHALAVVPSTTKMDSDRITNEEKLLSVCAGLAVMDDNRRTICLVDHTTMQFLERIRYTLSADPHEEITLICLTYLLYDAFARGRCLDPLSYEDLVKTHALLEYAARHWGDHARGQRRVGHKNTGMTLELLFHNSKVACIGQVMLLQHTKPTPLQALPHGYSGLHISSFFGLKNIVRSQLEHGATADLADSRHRTPLSWAAETGRGGVVKVLLSRTDVNPNSRDNLGRTPLSWAAENGHSKIVQVLVNRDDLDADLKDNLGRTALSRAAENGHAKVVQILVNRDDVDADSKDSGGWTPLSWAAAQGRVEVLRLLESVGQGKVQDP